MRICITTVDKTDFENRWEISHTMDTYQYTGWLFEELDP
jgi:hypothetical protein